MGAKAPTAIEEASVPGEGTRWAGEDTLGLGEFVQRQRPRVSL